MPEDKDSNAAWVLVQVIGKDVLPGIVRILADVWLEWAQLIVAKKDQLLDGFVGAAAGIKGIF